MANAASAIGGGVSSRGSVISCLVSHACWLSLPAACRPSVVRNDLNLAAMAKWPVGCGAESLALGLSYLAGSHGLCVIVCPAWPSMWLIYSVISMSCAWHLSVYLSNIIDQYYCEIVTVYSQYSDIWWCICMMMSTVTEVIYCIWYDSTLFSVDSSFYDMYNCAKFLICINLTVRTKWNGNGIWYSSDDYDLTLMTVYWPRILLTLSLCALVFSEVLY
jgi:hypothetical protein